VSDSWKHTHGAAGHGKLPSQRGAKSAFYITEHAIDRFRERVAPGLSPTHAKRECILLARGAKRTDEKSSHGDEVWVAQDGAPVRFVVKTDEQGMRVCATVLGPEDRESEPLMYVDAAAE
jgi:hypothetical protein